MSARAAASLAVVALAVAAWGCGSEGVADDATVVVYVSAPMRGPEAEEGLRLCREVGAQLGRDPVRVDGLRLEVDCLDASGPAGRWTLATVGANARRASEDSAAVAYIGEPDPRARRQSVPILNAAEIASLGGGSGAAAIRRVLGAIREGDRDDPRGAVYDAVTGG